MVRASMAKDFAMVRSYRLALVSDLFFGFINLFVYFFISRALGDAPSGSLGGAPSYFAFAAVGSTLLVVMQSAVGSVSGGVRDGQMTGTLEAVCVQPVTVAEIALGFAAYPVCFAMLRAAGYLVLADLILGLGLQQPDWAGFVIMLAATGLALVGLGVLIGAFVIVLKRSGRVDAVLMFALGFVGGGFFPLEVLPRWLRVIGAAVPTRFAFDGVRDALFRGEGWGTDAMILAAYGCVGLPIALQVFKWALLRAEKQGTLGQY
jgi:ABC-2 type transport system permease protein